MSITYHIARHAGQTFTRSSATKQYGYVTVGEMADGTFGVAGWSTKQPGGKGGVVLIADIVTKAEYDAVHVVIPQRPHTRPAPKALTAAVDLPDASRAFETREAWLGAFTSAARPLFVEVGAPIPEKVRLSVGFASKGVRSKTIGECWAAGASADGICEIFIVPALQSDTVKVAGVLTHELIHAALGHKEGHGKGFGRAARALGLEGKMTATTEGPAWHAWADPILAALGPFPGATLGADLELAGGKPKQATRYLKVACTCCDWTARVTAKHLEGRELSCPDRGCDGELEQAA